ncbi:MAG: cytochrome P450 [Gammaproteobacteria bacterium]|nr:cytochrome P450 [Gammaproteobacteria bacterium]
MATFVEQASPGKRFLRPILSGSIQLVLKLFGWLDRIINIPPEAEFDTHDPYPYFAKLQSKSPILRSYMYSGWAITGHEEITHLTRRSEISTDIRSSKFFSRVLKFAAGDVSVPIIDNPNMLNLDAPDHTRLRKLMASRFTVRFIQSLEPKIASQCQSLINKLEIQNGQFDLMESIAKPLPALVIADMLGVPENMYMQFREWSEALLGTAMIDQPDMIRKAGIANDALQAYFESLTEEKRKNPGQDLISQLLEAEEEGDHLTLKELHTNCILLLIAGHETTTRLIGNGMWLLLRHPEQLALLQQNRELIPNAIEEMLRFEPPVQAFSRIVKEDFEYKGYEFKKNQVALLFYAAANRDPRFIENPQIFDIQRKDPKHISFGHGVHLCLGMSLARLEAKIVFNQLLDNFPSVMLADSEPDWGDNPFFRGLNTLRLTAQ